MGPDTMGMSGFQIRGPYSAPTHLCQDIAPWGGGEGQRADPLSPHHKSGDASNTRTNSADISRLDRMLYNRDHTVGPTKLFT